jgi:hypothetical protein
VIRTMRQNGQLLTVTDVQHQHQMRYVRKVSQRRYLREWQEALVEENVARMSAVFKPSIDPNLQPLKPKSRT